jgi:hypothetical protein
MGCAQSQAAAEDFAKLPDKMPPLWSAPAAANGNKGRDLDIAMAVHTQEGTRRVLEVTVILLVYGVYIAGRIMRTSFFLQL